MELFKKQQLQKKIQILIPTVWRVELEGTHIFQKDFGGPGEQQEVETTAQPQTRPSLSLHEAIKEVERSCS